MDNQRLPHNPEFSEVLIEILTASQIFMRKQEVSNDIKKGISPKLMHLCLIYLPRYNVVTNTKISNLDVV